MPWPANAYGVSKVVGESFLQILCDETGTRGYALRIASYWESRGPLRTGPRAARLFLHAEDFAEIVLCCQRHDERQNGFARFFCTSRIPHPVLDIAETKRALGFEPRHDAADFYE